MVSGGLVEAFGSGGPRLTMTGSAAITAGQVVAFTGDRAVGPAADGSRVVAGVAVQSYDNVPGTRAKLAVATSGVWFLTASGAIAAGARVCAAAAGKVRAWVSGTDAADAIIGHAVEAAADGQSKRIILRAA